MERRGHASSPAQRRLQEAITRCFAVSLSPCCAAALLLHLLPCTALMSARLWPPPNAQSALEALGVQTRVQTAIEMREIAEPYIR